VSGVFIASLGHSGSTLLDLMLGSHPRLVSLGEVHATIARAAEKQNVCTCGKAADDCPVWGPVLAAVRKRLAADVARRKRRARETFASNVTWPGGTTSPR